MNIDPMKNIIVLKNLPSNMVEEAFVVLKDNVKIHKKEFTEKKGSKEKIEKRMTKDYVLKEAEMIVTDYISKVERREYETVNSNKKMKKRYKQLKALSIFLGIFSILSIIRILFG